MWPLEASGTDNSFTFKYYTSEAANNDDDGDNDTDPITNLFEQEEFQYIAAGLLFGIFFIVCIVFVFVKCV